jgi:lipoprotein-anchoring transpeptidase ErfK/SrfK
MMMSDAAPSIQIYLPQQRLILSMAGRVVMDVAISTAANGAGEQQGSECTPRGLHRIRAMIGAGCRVNTVFRGRRPTGEIYNATLAQQYPERDWILTRILWLCGMEPGKNRLGSVDTMRRFIYIHGTPDEVLLGQPGSHGCIRMRNTDMVRLFDQVAIGTRVVISDE